MNDLREHPQPVDPPWLEEYPTKWQVGLIFVGFASAGWMLAGVLALIIWF